MKTTTTFKAMMAMAFAMFTMTANAATAPKGNTWRDATPNIHIEVRHDNRNHRHYEVNWRTCRHNHLDRYGNRTFCHNCGAEMIWKGNTRNGHYEIIAPRPAAPVVVHHGGAPVTPTPNHKGNLHR